MNLKKKQEGQGSRDIKPSPREGTWRVANRWGRPACTYGHSWRAFCSCASSMCTAPEMLYWLIWHRLQASRPGLGRPAWVSFRIHSNFSGMLVSPSSFEFTAHLTKYQSRGVVGTHMCTNHKNTRRNKLCFYFIQFKIGGATDYKQKLTKQIKKLKGN